MKDHDLTLLQPVLFILLISSTPSAMSAFFFFLYDDVKLTTTEFGVMGLLGNVAALFGTSAPSITGCCCCID